MKEAQTAFAPSGPAERGDETGADQNAAGPCALLLLTPEPPQLVLPREQPSRYRLGTPEVVSAGILHDGKLARRLEPVMHFAA